MYAFRCTSCERICYSASADTGAACPYCHTGRVEILDTPPSGLAHAPRLVRRFPALRLWRGTGNLQRLN